MALTNLGKSVFSQLDLLKEKVTTAARERAVRRYERGGRLPWSDGYGEFRRRSLRGALRDPELIERFRASRDLPSVYGFRIDARVVEIPWALARLQSEPSRVLDAGSSLNHDYVIDSDALRNKDLHILTLSPEERCFCERSISYLFGDLRKTVFRDETFDEVICISVIEHVGMDNSMYGGAAESSPDAFVYAIDELKRVLRPGGRLLITFPFGRYENHGWFQQFDDERLDQLIERFEPSHAAESIYRYEPDGWVLSDRTSCSECRFFDVQEYLREGRRIEYPEDFAAAERAVACLELEK